MCGEPKHQNHTSHNIRTLYHLLLYFSLNLQETHQNSLCFHAFFSRAFPSQPHQLNGVLFASLSLCANEKKNNAKGKTAHKLFGPYKVLRIKKKKKPHREFASAISILFYFTILKSYFINYIIQFYNTTNIPTFIFIFYSLK